MSVRGGKLGLEGLGCGSVREKPGKFPEVYALPGGA